MNREQALKIAIQIGEKLKPFSERINIAGSIRREKAEVKDIELLCIPMMINRLSGDLFAVKSAPAIHPEFISMVSSLGKVIKGQTTGRYMQIDLVTEGIKLDLFMPASWDYYRQYAIRTGSADYAARSIAAAWKRKGWCGSDKGLRLQVDCLEVVNSTDGKSSWRCINPKAETPPVWQSEAEFFGWLGIPLIHPKMRTI